MCLDLDLPTVTKFRLFSCFIHEQLQQTGIFGRSSYVSPTPSRGYPTGKDDRSGGFLKGSRICSGSTAGRLQNAMPRVSTAGLGPNGWVISLRAQRRGEEDPNR